MKSLKSHLSLIIALFSILFAIKSYLFVENVLKYYEKDITSQYSLFIISQNKIIEDEIKNRIKTIESVKEISTKKVINDLKNDVSKISLDLLKTTMPKFYEVKFSAYPSTDKLKSIKNILLSMPGILKTETFTNTHKQIYTTLVFTKSVIYFFSFSLVLISILLMAGEMRLWQYAHQERMSIMALFGAPLMLKSSVLFKFAFLDSIFSIFFIILAFMFIENNGLLAQIISILNLGTLNIDLYDDMGTLIISSFSISFGLALFVMIKHKDKEL
jgi:cell division transport system permease protein